MNDRSESKAQDQAVDLMSEEPEKTPKEAEGELYFLFIFVP